MIDVEGFCLLGLVPSQGRWSWVVQASKQHVSMVSALVSVFRFLI